MADVYNWQLGRNMYYPYPENHPRWQFAFVFNINRCIACQTCSMACKSTWTFSKGQEYMWWNNVETKPYGGHPQHWDTKLLRILEEVNPGRQIWNTASKNDLALYGRFDGVTIFEGVKLIPGREEVALGYMPTDEEWRAPNIFEDTAAGYEGKPGQFSSGVMLPEHSTWFFYMQRLCNHCSYPGCLSACPRKAIYKRPEDGIVLIDQSRCRGYRKCVEQCPYKRPMFRTTTQISEKCIACYPRIEGNNSITGGLPTETRCMTACVGKIRLQGLVRIGEDGKWAKDPKNPLYFLIKVAQVALPLYPQFGTEPNGYYIPPRWAPRAYLRQMFGPGVDQAIARYTAPSRELLAILQLFRTTQKIIFRFEIEPGNKIYEANINGQKWEMYDDTVIGLDKEGKELVRVKVEESFYVREAKLFNSI